MIEKFDKNQKNKKLEEFYNEIRYLINKELAALYKSEAGTVHFITNPKMKETNFNVEDLTEEDMEMYYKIKNKKAELEEFKKYKERIFSSGENISNSRKMFAAYLSNLFMVFNFNKSQK